MKHIYNPLKSLALLFLLFSFTLSSPEYYRSTNNVPTVRMNLNVGQSTPNSSFHAGFRNKHSNDQSFYSSTKNKISTVESASIHHNGYDLCHPLKLHRHNILEQFIHNNPTTHRTYSTQYYITDISQKFLSAHNLDSNILKSCEGNLLQHTIHYEFIVLTDTTAHLWNERSNSPEIQKLTNIIADFTNAGTSFNQIGHITKAMALADAGWAMLDCIQAAGEGFIEGIASVTHTASHPIETAQNLTRTITTCGYYLGIAFNEINTIANALGDGKFDIAYNKYNIWSEHCKNIAQALNEQCKDLKLRDIVKTVTQTAVECYATTRALNAFGTFFKHAHRNATQIAKKINTGAQESSLLMSTEGIPVRVAQEIITQANKLPRANDKLLQILSKFKSQKIKIENNTFLFDKRGLKHILERHHPLYWDGSLATTQTFLHEKTTIQDIVHIIKEVMKQNKKSILEHGTQDFYQIHGIINEIKYTVGFDNGRIGQFFIPLKK